MNPSHRSRILVTRQLGMLAAVSATILYGCASSQDAADPASADAAQTSDASPAEPLPVASSRHAVGESSPIVAESPLDGTEPAQGVIDARPAAIVNGKMINWSELRPTLTEIAGGDALREAILDRTLAAALADAGISISPDDAAAERKMLLESLDEDPDVAIRLLDEMRLRECLGRVRFDALMRRNAGLRALVRSQVRITEDSIQQMHEVLHGPKRLARMMTLPDLNGAQSAINLVKSGVSFGDVAVEMSTDASAARGGLLDPISRVDPAYPASLRETLWALNAGEMSGPVQLDNGFAVLMLVKRIAGDGVSLEESRLSLEKQVRLRQERLLMDQLSRKMLAATSVKIFDDALSESWNRQNRTSR